MSDATRIVTRPLSRGRLRLQSAVTREVAEVTIKTVGVREMMKTVDWIATLL
jgi:hypothetical protein